MHDSLQPHLRITANFHTRYALLPGDPARVEEVAKYLEQPKHLAFNREFKTISGRYKGIPLLVTSTGIGGASTGIAVEELKNAGVNVMIRIGSCGSLQEDIHIGELVIASGAVRNDGASDAYIERAYPAIPDAELLFHLIHAAKSADYKHYIGRIRSHDSFYTDRENEIDAYWSKKGILAADMETAALFVIGGLRGIKTASILNVVVEKEGSLEGGINDYTDQRTESKQGEHKEIHTALEAIASYHDSINR
ncbi:nucleoside phosphorylase [Peribacillus sp. SCS-155]|uniref:nucleoside phosphorylase n=1 Tax=Peribacillus sedimenti TaxID=3115297 RepID=UPI003906643E